MDIPEVNLADYVFENASEYSNNPALVCGMSGRQYTYEMSKQLSIKFGSAMRRLGAQKGDVVAFILPNIPEFAIGFLGCAGAGLAVTTMSPSFKEEEIIRQLENSEAQYILTIGKKILLVNISIRVTQLIRKIRCQSFNRICNPERRNSV